MNTTCDKIECTEINPEVRLLPYGGGGNMIECVCRSCFNHEMEYRKQRNREIKEDVFKLPKWEDLKVYEPF